MNIDEFENDVNLKICVRLSCQLETRLISCFFEYFYQKKKKRRRIRRENDDLNENEINEVVLFINLTKKEETRHLTRFLSILIIDKFNEKLSNNQKLQLKTIRMICCCLNCLMN